MGQAKRRGDYETRVAQARERDRLYWASQRAEMEAAEQKRREEYQRRVDAGEAVPIARTHRPMMPLLLGVALAAAMTGSRGYSRRHRHW